jgi:hypothetical protein
MQIVYQGSKIHLQNNKQMARSTSSINTSPTKISSNDNPNSVVHLVHNLNNKNDNTLKKRNALVAFEFKTLLDRVASPDAVTKSPNRQSDSFIVTNSALAPQPLIQSSKNSQWQQQQHKNHHHHHQHHKRNHSPQSLSSTSSTCSTASSSPSTSSSKKLDSIRGVSPSQLTNHVKFNGHHDYDNSNLYKITNQSNLKSKSQILTNASTKSIVVSNVNSKIRFEVKNLPESHTTIWREELNAKSNVQEQIKKQVGIFFLFYLTFFCLFYCDVFF